MRLLAFLVVSAAVFFAGAFQASADIPPPYTEYTIGASMTEGEPFPKIDRVSKSGPAEKAGLKVGDQVIGLNGVYSKTNAPFYFFAKGLRGPKDSVAELIVLRNDAQVIVIKIKRTVRS
jgi:C-terminal processing protease CtpA/Prc